MTTYEHACLCGYEWEAVYGMKEDPPTLCPSCNQEGGVKRLISGGSGRGIVRLTGHDLNAKIKSDVAKDRVRLQKDENFRANFVGEKYHEQQLQKDSLTNDLLKIGKDATTIKNTNTTHSKIKRSK